MLPRNKNENIPSLTNISDKNISSNFVESGVDNDRETRETSSRRQTTQSKTSNKVTPDKLNNNKNNIAKNRCTNIKVLANSAPCESDDNDIVSDFDLVSAFSNFRNKSPTTPTTTTFKPLIVQPNNSNNPTETFNILSPILNVTNQMTDVSYKHLTSSVNSNTNSNKGKPLESNMKTTNSPNHLRQHNNVNATANMVASSAPNTPEAMRRQQLLMRHRTSDTTPVANTNALVSHLTPTILAGKKEKMEYNQMMMRMNYEKESRPLSYHGKSTSIDVSNPSSQMSSPINKRHVVSNAGSAIGSPSARNGRKEMLIMNRRSMPSPYLENRLREKFDISDLDTNLPRIDLEAIENHLRLAREEERKRRTDREEIRRRLALESDDIIDKNGMSGRKPSLHSRLQSSMNLQICFMNETASDSESPGSDTEIKHSQPPASLPCQATSNKTQSSGNVMEGNEVSGGSSSEDFYARQARLQADARRALSQAKDLARLQMTQEKERRLQSPITEMVRNSLQKVGVTLPSERRRVSRQLLTDLNVAQLQVIVNDLHSHIEVLNETLVSMLLERDDLHMEQDSMLVDIEDLTRYLAAKDNSPHQSLPLIQPSKSLLGKK